MKVGILGAAFDPPHLGHQRVVLEMLKLGLVDQVWLMPVKAHPFGKQISSETHRLAMVEHMYQALIKSGLSASQVKVETYELDQPQTSYSILTLQHFQTLHPDWELSWIIGSDNATHFGQWHRAAELLSNFTVWVYPRPGSLQYQLLPGMKPVATTQTWDISSTQVRAAITQQQSVQDLVLPEIEQYSKLHHLYVPDSV